MRLLRGQPSLSGSYGANLLLDAPRFRFCGPLPREDEGELGVALRAAQDHLRTISSLLLNLMLRVGKLIVCVLEM